MDKHDKELLLMIGMKSALVLGVGFFIYLGLTSFLRKEESWPPKDAEDETRIIGEYKQRLLIGDTPISELKPETAAVYLGRIVDHALKEGDKQTARDYAGQAIDRKLHEQAEKAMTTPEARLLLAKIQDGRRKRDALNGIVGIYEKRPDDKAPADVRGKLNRDLQEAIEAFRRVPFEPETCPELAREMNTTYHNKLVGWKNDARLKDLLGEFDRLGLSR